MLPGVCDGVSVVLRTTILQLATPDAMRGRVSSINGLFIGSSNELGAFYAGSMARLLGLVPVVVLGGGVTLGVVGVTSWRAPKCRRVDLRDRERGVEGREWSVGVDAGVRTNIKKNKNT